MSIRFLTDPSDYIDNTVFLHGVLESSSDCIKVLDLEGNLLFMNEGGKRKLEIDDFDAIKGSQWPTFWEGAEGDLAKQAVEKAQAGIKGHFQGSRKTQAGNDRWWDVVITPMLGPAGRPEKLLVVSRDVTEWRDAQQALSAHEKQLTFAMTAGRLGYWRLDLATMTLTPSDLLRTQFGFEPGSQFDFDTLLASIYPDDRPDVTAAFQRCRTYGGECDIESRVQLAAGGIGWVLIRGQTELGADGTPEQITGITLDISRQKQAEEQQKLLAHEVSHRMKNTLAMVQAIGNQTLRAAESVEHARVAFSSRLLALSRAQDILTATGWESAPLRSVILSALQPHGTRFTVAGPDLQLSARCALAMSLAINELATNAAKYGCLAQESGMVMIEWCTDFGSFAFSWTESGGAPVQKPTRSGFGSRLIEKTLASYMNGEAELRFEPSGLAFRLTAPVSGLQAG